MDTALPVPHPSTRHVLAERMAVVLYEDACGRLVVADPRRPRPEPATPLLRIGRARLALHHLAPTVLAQLREHGRATVEGPDAVNVLLAFADDLGPATRPY